MNPLTCQIFFYFFIYIKKKKNLTSQGLFKPPGLNTTSPLVEIAHQKENNVSLITLERGGGFRNEKVLKIGA